MTLRSLIAEEIGQRGPIPFSRYMELCLYHSELGYYSRTREQFGKAGDFYTASDVHAVFGRLLARQFDEMWRAMGAPPRIDLIELGPGRGLFAQDVLDWSKKKFPDFLDALHYTLVERSPGLCRRLQERFQTYMTPAQPGCSARVSLAAELEEVAAGMENGIVFGNEFFDALPVEVVSPEGQLHVAVEGDRFVECFTSPSAAVLEFIDRYGVHPGPEERVEVPLVALGYLRRMARLIERGFMVLVDYGYTREELLAGRPKSTLRAFRQHSLSDNPYEAPGEQDLTANVNFTSLRAAALAAGFEQATLLTQAQFLMGIGEQNQFADAFENVTLAQEHAKVALQLKHLVTPAGMGEIFQVLVARKDVEKDKAAGLSGMAFARSE
jgi:SAM-dependent MidA family methyltransferase